MSLVPLALTALPASANVAAGATVYANVCSTCHGPSAAANSNGISAGANNPSLIQSLVTINFGGMGVVSSTYHLTATDIANVADYLGSVFQPVVGTPAIATNPTSIAFPEQAVGTTSSGTSLKISNPGSDVLNISGITSSSSDFTLVSGCAATLAAGANCFVTVMFAPKSAGAISGSLTIQTNATPAATQVALSGTGVAVPTCTLTTSPAAIAAGGSSTLSASCSPAASSYVWTGAACAASSATCTVSPSATTTYSVAGVNGAGTGAAASATVTVTPKSICTLSASPTDIAPGESATLTANCGPVPTSYTWSTSACSSSAATCTVAPTSTTNYSVAGVNSAGTGPLAVVSVGVTVKSTVPSTPYTGLFWNPAESGWGLSLTQSGSTIFAAWFTYGSGGKPTWYVMSSCPVVGKSCTGSIYSVVGGTAPVLPWNGAGKLVTEVGGGTLNFTDNDNAVFNYTLNGVTAIRNLTRQAFASGSTAPQTDYSALWWNPNESGWGVALTQEFGMIFVAMFTYDANGKPIWYVASSCPVAGNGCSGPLYQVGGGTAPTTAWNGANVAVAPVGNISFVFTDGSTGTMNFTINGVSGSRAIVRQVF